MSHLPARVVAVLSGLTLALTLTATPSSAAPSTAASPSTTPPGTASAAARPVTLTLITGDVVVYTPARKGAPATTIKPAPRPGGATVTFATLPSLDGGYLVLPSDAAPLVAAGRLDEELFDVDTLARDERITAIPLIVDYGPEAARAMKAADALPATEHARPLDAINGAAVTVPAKDAKTFWTGLVGDGAKKLAERDTSTGIEKIWLDRRVRMSLDKSVPLIGAPTGWQRGLDGTGVKVAVLDTGIDATHPDFAGRIAATQNFSNSPTTADKVGHGTHVASTIAGSGAASGGKYKGVAPGASLLVGKVLDDGGNGDWSWAIAGMQWAAEQGADVVNMSLGGCCGDGTDPMSEALNELTKKYGTLFVAAAGNKGDRLTVSVPAAADQALAVGAVDKDTGTTLAAFSSKGPRLSDAAVKPNIVAPGVDIVAARSADSTMPPVPGADRYTQISGTSMATPHVAGAAAILAQQHSGWTAAELRDALSSTAQRNLDHTWFEQGSGRVNVARAVTQQVFATSVVDFGLPGKAPATRPISYRNTGAQPVTLTLELTTKGWSGNPAPNGAVRLAATSLTVPANGTATVDLTIDPRIGAVGAYGGWIAASGVNVQLVTPFSYYTGPATHRLGISMVNSYGTKEFIPGYQAEPYVYVVPLKRGNSSEDPFNPAGYYYLKLDYSGDGEVWLPAGDYEVVGLAPESGLSSRNSWVVETVTLDGDRTVTLDARKTVPTRPVMRSAADGGGAAWYVRTFGDRVNPVSVYGGVVAGQDLYVTPVPSVSAGTLRLSHQWDLRPPELASATAGTLTLHPAYDADTLRGTLTGVATYPVVFAGQGRTEDFQNLDVAGKLVLVAVPAGGSATPYVPAVAQMDDAAMRALDKGAAGILGYLDADGTRGRVPAARSLTFHRFGLSTAEGRALRAAVAAGPVSLRLEPYVGPDVAYHLRFDDRGRVPDKPHEVDTSTLTKIDVSYHADKPDTSGWQYGESSTGEEPGRLTYGGPMRMPVARTEYFGPIDSRVLWSRQITGDGLVLNSADRFTETTRAERWFKAPLTAGAADVPRGYPIAVPCAMCRDGDRFVPAEQWLDSDPRHYSELSAVSSTPKLTVGGQQLAAQGWRPRYFTVPGGTAQYQLDAVDTSGRTLSSRVTTSSRFTAAPPSGTPVGYACSFGPACAVQPSALLTYDLPLDLLNHAFAGQTFDFEVRAGAHSSVSGAPTVTWASVEWSVDDGATWRSAGVTKQANGRFRAQLTHPPLAQTNGYVSLRVTAWDDKGGTTAQTINRAYALK